MSDAFLEGLRPEVRADAEAFVRFVDSWSQDDADYEPEEWARAEHLTAVFRAEGMDVSVRRMAGILRSCELFDALDRPGLEA